MSSVAKAVEDVDHVDAAIISVPAAVAEEGGAGGGEIANGFLIMREGVDGVSDLMSDLSGAQKSELESWYRFVKNHPRNPWLALDVRLQETLASWRSREQTEFAKRCYCDMVEPFDFELYYACINMAIMSEDDVLGYRVYDERDPEVPDAYRMIAGTETYCYKKPGSLFTDHVERVIVYKSGDAAKLVEEGTYCALQEIFEAHCEGDESKHWTNQYRSKFSRGCPRCGVKCWLYGPCAECFAECEQRWHIACGSSSVEHKLKLDGYLMEKRGIGKRAREKILEGGCLRKDRWQILASTIHLAEALKRVTTYVDVPDRCRYRLIKQFVDHLFECGKDRGPSDGGARDGIHDPSKSPIKDGSNESAAAGEGDDDLPSDLDDSSHDGASVV